MVANSIGAEYPRPNRRPATTPAAQLGIAAQWLHDAAILLTELKHVDMSMHLSRVAHDCERVAVKSDAKLPVPRGRGVDYDPIGSPSNGF